MKYFNISEFDCSCGNNCNEMNKDFMEKLDKARGYSGTPFKITSGYRCKKHNENVGGVKESTHIKGLGADIKCDSSRERMLILKGLLRAGFSRIGLYSWGIHADSDERKPSEVMWIGK